MKSLLKQFVAVISGLLLLTTTTMAITPTTLVPKKVDQFIEERCTAGIDMINQLTTKYRQKRDLYISSFNQIKDSANLLNGKLNEQGYDINASRGNLETINNYILRFSTAYTSFEATMEEAKVFACGNNSSEYKTTLNKAKQFLKDMRISGQQTIAFMQNEFNQTLLDLKNQTPKKESSD